MKKVGLFLAIAVLCGACGPDGFQSNTVANVVGGNDGLESTPGSPTPETLQADLKSTVDEGPNAGSLALDIDVQGEFILIRVPMASAALIGLPIVSMQIPSLPGASFQTVIDSQGRNAIVISIPIDKFLKGFAVGTPGRLPNGDPLPYVTRGELPTTAISLDVNKNTKLHLYIGVDQVVAFVETPQFDPMKMIQNLPIVINQLIFPVKNKRKQTVAYFGYIGSKNAHPGGFYLATGLPPALVQLLDNYFFNH